MLWCLCRPSDPGNAESPITGPRSPAGWLLKTWRWFRCERKSFFYPGWEYFTSPPLDISGLFAPKHTNRVAFTLAFELRVNHLNHSTNRGQQRSDHDQASVEQPVEAYGHRHGPRRGHGTRHRPRRGQLVRQEQRSSALIGGHLLEPAAVARREYLPDSSESGRSCGLRRTVTIRHHRVQSGRGVAGGEP